MFELKCDALIEEIYKHDVLWNATALFHTIELKKERCSICISLFFDRSLKVNNSKDVVRLESTKILDQGSCPLLFDIVLSCMIHNSCGEGQSLNDPCLEGIICS